MPSTSTRANAMITLTVLLKINSFFVLPVVWASFVPLFYHRRGLFASVCPQISCFLQKYHKIPILSLFGMFHMKLFTQIAVFQGLHLSILGMIVFHVKRHKNFRSEFVVSRETTGAKIVVLRKMYKKNIPPKQDVFDKTGNSE